MQASLYRDALSQLRKEGLFVVSNLKGTLTVAAEGTIFIALAVALAHVEPWGFAFIALQVLAGLSIFRMFVILHECGHRTLFRHRLVNSIVGHVASIFCLVPYFPWRHIHLLHHRWVGIIDKDPTQRDLLKLRDAPAAQDALFRILWRLWIPLPFMKFLFEVFWGYPGARIRDRDRKHAWQGLISVAVCLAAHGAAIAVLGPGTWATYFLPMLFVFYLMIENMNLPQHSGLFPYLSDTHPAPIALAQQDAITRSSHMPDWLGVALALNFNRHVEHHLFPAAPWYALNRVRTRLSDSFAYKPPHEVPFMGFMIRLRRQDPLTIYRDRLPQPAVSSVTAASSAGNAAAPVAVAQEAT